MTPSGQTTSAWSLLEGQRLRLGGALAALLLAAALTGAVPLVTGLVLDGLLGVTGTPSASVLARWPALREALAGRLDLAACAVVALTVAAGACAYLRGRWPAQAAEAIALRLRRRLWDRIQRMPAAAHEKADTGDLVQRCTSDLETVRAFLAAQLVEVGHGAALLAVALPLMAATDLRMAFVSLALFPLIVGLAVAFFGRIQRRFREVDEAEAAMTTMLHESLTGVRVVRAFSRAEFERGRFERVSGAYRDLMATLMRTIARYWGLSDGLCLLQVGLVLVAGMAWVRAGSLSVGTLFAFMTWVGLLIFPLRQGGRILAEAGKARVALDRIRDVLDQPVEEDDPAGADPDALPLMPIEGALELRDVTFSPDGRTVLDGVSLSVPAGATLALVGPPGAGKSAIVRLLLRLHDPDSGCVLLDGRDLRSLPRRVVRRAMASVLQEPFLFSRTLSENVALDRSGIGAPDVGAAVEAASLGPTVRAMPQGLDTVVGERGVTLSGGQRQRLAIARAIAAGPPVLVLDDALSAVDVATEARIRTALAARRGRRTTVVVAHRLSSVLDADLIVVLDRGRIVQRGTHEALSRVEGAYRRLWLLQSETELATARVATEGGAA